MRRSRSVADHAVGWIAMTDVLMLVSVLALCGTAGLSHLLQERGRLLEERTRENGRLSAALTADQKTGLRQKEQLDAALEELATLQAAMDRTQAEREAERAELEEAREAERQALAREKTANDTLAQLEPLRSRLQELEQNAAQLAAMKRETEEKQSATAQRLRELESKALGEGELRKELVGITTNLDRVVFVLDSSGSMLSSRRWEWTVQTACRWVELLPVKNAAMVVFSDTASPFPADKTLLPMTPETRQTLLQELRRVKPEGLTNTLDALKLAIDGFGEVDSIILFTDGKPENRKGESAKLIREIEEYLDGRAKHKLRTPPINVIGLGNYFEPEFGAFLLRLSSKTNGAFIGR